MTMKVQGSSAAAVQTTQNTQSAQASQSSQPSPSAERVRPPPSTSISRDGFDAGRRKDVDLDKILGGGKVGMPFADRRTASDLHKTLSNPLNDHILSAEKKSETLTRDEKGIYRGPNGQPLVPVTLDDGKTAYVDPNTNKYYLTDEQPDAGGNVRTLPAIDLPKDAQFTNRYFNDEDAKDLTKIASRQFPYPLDPVPFPFPEPPFPHPVQPLPFPEPSPFPIRPRLDLPDFGPLRDRNIAV